MTVRYTVDVFCDECANWFHYTVTQFPRNRAARKAAKSVGWKTKRNSSSRFMVDICPACQADQEEER